MMHLITYYYLDLRVLCSHSVALGSMYFQKQQYERIVSKKSGINRLSGLAKISVPSVLHFDEKIQFHEFCSK